MKWVLLIIFVLALAAFGYGTVIANGPGSADERVGGAIFWLIGALLLGIDLLALLIWAFVSL